MNFTVKRCLMGLVASATMFGIARAQDEPVGTVQLGPKVQGTAPGAAQQAPVEAEGALSLGTDLPPSPGMSGLPPGPGSVNLVQPGTGVNGNYYKISRVDQILAPRFNVDSRGGGLYGYNAGYSNIGVFVPYKLDDTAILFGSAQGLVTYDGRGGASVGAGWRYWNESLDRVTGLSTWFDFDNGHARPFQQVGFSFESLGRYMDYRVNGYLPVSKPDHVLVSDLVGTPVLMGNSIGLTRNNTVEQAFAGFDAEVGGPTPILGQYGLNAYVGGYQFQGMGVNGGSFTGVSGRLLSQINEDVSFGVQVTNDHMFGLNTQFQVFANLPNGKPGRWLRNWRVQDKLVAQTFRQNRVIAKTESFTSYDTAINPETHQAYFVANINPNLTTNGNGSVSNPFDSIANYEAVPLAQRQRYDFILVQPRTDGSSTNLDTAGTLELYSGQHLLSTSTTHTFVTENLPNQVLTLPISAGTADPILVNSTGGNVITLAPGNTRGMEVSGFEIVGNASGTLGTLGYVPATGNGIFGNNIYGLNVNSNNIHGALNGVLVTNLTGSFAAKSAAQFVNNNIHDNSANGVQVTNNGSPPFVTPLDVRVQGNIFRGNGGDGMQLNAQGGSTIGGIIGGANTAATATSPAITLSNTFDGNGTNGLDLMANGGTLNFLTPATAAATTVPFGIFNNIFTANTLDGLHIQTVGDSVGSFVIQNNQFGIAGTSTSGNKQYGIGLVSDSGTTTMLIGGQITTNTDGSTTNPGNLFNFNAVTAINLAVNGTANLSYEIDNNTISNAISTTIPAPHDEFTFTFNGISGTDPFIITNLSDPGVSITGVTWNLAGTPATIAPGGILGTRPVLQPLNGTDITTGLVTVGNATIIQGSVPLRIAGTNAIAGVSSVLNGPETGLANFSQLLPLTFNKFAPSTAANPLNFQATALFQQNGGSAALTSAATNGSTMSVTFSNGLTSTVKVAQTVPTSVGVSAQGDVFGTATPGFGTGSDGIHVSAGGASVLNTSTIEHNTITGYGGYGVHVETSGTADASHVLIQNNTIQQNGSGVNGAGNNVFTGGGINVTRGDSSTLNALIENNVVTLNFNSGLEIDSSGTTTGSFNVFTQNNDFRNNAGNGLQIDSSGASILNYTTIGDNFSGNGGGSGKNVAVTGGDDIAIITRGTSVANINLNNVLANNANGNGLSATTNDNSTLNLLVTTTNNPNFTGQSSFSTNKLNGVLLNSNNTSFMHANIYNAIASNNVLDGISFTRTGAAYVRSTIAGTTMSNNGVNGFSFHGLGSDPQDPTQQHSGSPNKIILLNDTLTFNGNFATGVGQGARLDLFGDSELVLDANNTTFSNNAQNGIRIKLDPGAEFGYEVGNERSILDNVTINNNGSNGIFLTSDISPVLAGSINNNLPFDAPSVTFMQISSNTGNTTISNNGFGANGATGLSGVLLQYLGGNHDILITGDENSTAPTYTTLIQGNNLNGIESQTSAEGNVLLTLDKVTIGGPELINGNGRHGIDFETVAVLTIVDGATTETRAFTQTGDATLNVNNSLIQNNGFRDPNNVGHGINLVSDDTIGGSTPVLGGSNGTLNANLTNNTIVDNAGDGVNIFLQGSSGGFRLGSGFASGVLSTITMTGNTISNNGQFGVRMEQNANNQVNFFSDFNDPQPTNPPQPFNPNNLFNPLFGLAPGFSNEGNATDLQNGGLLSNWMQLETFNNARLNLFNNVIQGNGKSANLRLSDGVFIRVSTDSYLAADIQNNNISGNVGNDLHIESFIQYNPLTGVSYQPPASIARAAPALDRVFYDNTAQLDLRLVGNVGNTVNIQSPLVNSGPNGIGGILPGNTTPNGAFYLPEPLKDNFSFTNPQARMVQLFQVDNGVNLNSLNSFTQNGTTQDLQSLFQFGQFHLRAAADPLFPNPLFAEQYSDQPGNPFLP